MIFIRTTVFIILGILSANTTAIDPSLLTPVAQGNTKALGIDSCLIVHAKDQDPRSFELKLASSKSDGAKIHAEVTFEAQGVLGFLQTDLPTFAVRLSNEAGVVEVQAKLNFDKLTDTEYYDELDRAEELDTPFSTILDDAKVVVSDKDWSTYVSDRRGSERFPSMKNAVISVHIPQGPAIVLEHGNDKESLGLIALKYNGECKITLRN